MSIKMAIVGGGGSTGTHLLATILHGLADIRIGPEIHITHHAAFFPIYPKTLGFQELQREFGYA